MEDDAIPAGGEPVDDDVLWDSWHPEEAAERLAEVWAPWCVVGGWALDLFLGEQTREHDDLEIAVPADAFLQIVEELPGLDFDVVGAGRRWPLESEAFDVMHQTWGRETASGVYRLDVFREPHDDDIWICRRDETIRLPYSEVIEHSESGVPYLVPEIVLLFKAKQARAKDQADFSVVLPRLDGPRREWLSSALARVHPGHPWITRL